MVAYTIEVQLREEAPGDLDVGRLQTAIAWVLNRHSVTEGATLAVVITGDDTVRKLNRQFRHIDAPTDVLSFPANPLPKEIAEELYLGDLVLSFATIKRQAEREGHSVSDELMLAAIHGTLHLLGYDHDTQLNQKKMWSAQAEALHAMQVAIQVPEFDVSVSSSEHKPIADQKPE